MVKDFNVRLCHAFESIALFSTIKDKVTTKFQGELIADLDTLPVDQHGKEISMSIRRHAGKRPHLQVKLAETGAADYFQIPCSREWADQFEKELTMIIGTTPLAADPEVDSSHVSFRSLFRSLWKCSHNG